MGMWLQIPTPTTENLALEKADDILAVDSTTIKDVKVLRTIVGGKTVYER